MSEGPSILSQRVLVLNRSWIAVHVTTVRRGIGLVYGGQARIVDPHDYSTHDFDSWKSHGEENPRDGVPHIHSPNFSIMLPEVLQLSVFNRVFNQEINFTRRNIYDRDNGCCQYCGRRVGAKEFTLEHILPRSRGGPTTWDNVIVACSSCNSRKGDRLLKECGMKLLSKPVKPKWATPIGVRLAHRVRSSWQRFIPEAYWKSES